MQNTESSPNLPSQSNQIPNNGQPEPKGPPQACLFVANLDDRTTDEALRAHFEQYGPILKVKVMKDKKNERPFAFIQYTTVEGAEKALQDVNGHQLLLDNNEHRRLRVEHARVNRTLFLAKLGLKMTAQAMKEYFESNVGPIETATILKNHRTNGSKGCGFVKFVYREDAVDAFLRVKAERRWVVEWSTSENSPDKLGIDRCQIFVGGIHPSATQEMVMERFGKYGEIQSINLVKRNDDPNEEIPPNVPAGGRSLFAFIRYCDPTSASRGIDEEHGQTFMDRVLRVQYCESNQMKQRKREQKQGIMDGRQPMMMMAPFAYAPQGASLLPSPAGNAGVVPAPNGRRPMGNGRMGRPMAYGLSPAPVQQLPYMQQVPIMPYQPMYYPGQMMEAPQRRGGRGGRRNFRQNDQPLLQQQQ